MGTGISITSVGNAGFRICLPDAVLFIDAFYDGIRGVADPPWLEISGVERADVVLVTHAHPDHFNRQAVVQVADVTGAIVVGPPVVLRMLAAEMRPDRLVAVPGRQPLGAVAWRRSWPWGTVTAISTSHGKEHISYLLEAPGLRLFHDGDNEDTRCVPIGLVDRLDVLLLGPWQGSGWVDWIEALRPERYVLMHLTAEERAEHAVGRYLVEICDRVPPGLCILAPGDSLEVHSSCGSDAGCRR
ncbi:MAG: hypothetical protein A3K19_15670 [Lentisphaerae bacterium RIFOXYB12_FULL_65_16]|nr:MAG: hypothetical protein A3K18_28375 [Lentisphaerae bacterium RIFOXYA12_64_32]OGV87367.1 MAG: hypothetical protein A3K19_15670 [Lentisphaerae bacterium RIFOXYB12_FULL_65_16]